MLNFEKRDRNENRSCVIFIRRLATDQGHILFNKNYMALSPTCVFSFLFWFDASCRFFITQLLFSIEIRARTVYALQYRLIRLEIFENWLSQRQGQKGHNKKRPQLISIFARPCPSHTLTLSRVRCKLFLVLFKFCTRVYMQIKL